MKPLQLVFILTAVAAQCPPGLNPLLSNSRPTTCSPQDVCSCQRQHPGAVCQYSLQHSHYICCSGQTQRCGSSSSPLLSPNGQTVQCQSSQECGSGFTCSQGTCCASATNPACSSGQCMFGQVYVDGQCLNTVPIGSVCQQTQQCLGNSVCMNSRCQCPYGTTNIKGTCACELGMVLVNGQCESLASPGMSCVAQEQCIDNSDCIARTCTCKQGYALINGYCIPYLGSGPCPPTQTLVNNRCVTYSVIGGPCLADAQCVGGAVCQNAVCQCRRGNTAMFGFCIADHSTSRCSDSEVFVDGQCLRKVPVGYLCRESAQCLNGARCLNGICQCGVGQSFVNGICTDGGDGSGGTGVGCPSNQVVVNGRCMPTVEIAGRCISTIQCLGNSDCISGFCRCSSGSQLNGKCSSPECGPRQVFVNNRCHSMALVGGQCTYNDQCTGYSQCNNGYCRCEFGAVESNGICRSQSSKCKSYQVAVNNQCLDRVSIGQSCSNEAQCIPRAVCSTTCQCPYPYSYNGSACLDGVTYCGQGTVSLSGQCLGLVPLGQSCLYSAQCMGFGYCTSAMCSCRRGYTARNGVCRMDKKMSDCGANQVLVGSECYPTVKIGDQCTYSEQCLGGSRCIANACRCPANSVDYGDGKCNVGGPDANQMCPSSGEEVIYAANSVTPIDCRIQPCPSNSYCYNNRRLGQYFCCRQLQNSGTTRGCNNPSQSIVYKNGAAINCLYASCPLNSHCEFSSIAQQYVCCR